MRDLIILCEAVISPAEMFIKTMKANQRFRNCQFEIENSTTVFLFWLEGGNGLVPFLTNVADNFGVTLTLSVDVHGRNDGGKLVSYYMKNGFEIISSDFDPDYDFANMPDEEDNEELFGQVSMIRIPKSLSS